MRHIFMAAVTLAALIPATAQAGVNGVTHIEVSNAIGEWLQVAQVQAFGAGGTDFALASNGATASATSQLEATGPNGRSGANNAINATIGGDYFSANPANWIYHSGSQAASETLTVTFAAPTSLSSFTIWGRYENQSQRDIYNVRLYGGRTLLASYSSLDARSQNFVTVDLGPIAGGVPEPSAWALLILGFGAVGAAQRRRTRTSSFA